MGGHLLLEFRIGTPSGQEIERHERYTPDDQTVKKNGEVDRWGFFAIFYNAVRVFYRGEDQLCSCEYPFGKIVIHHLILGRFHGQPTIVVATESRQGMSEPSFCM